MAPVTQVTTPPEHLSPESKKVWTDIVGECDMDSAALVILRTLCDANDRRLEARASIEKAGSLFVKDRFGVVKSHPGLAVERDATLAMQRAYRLLGLDQAPSGQMGFCFEKSGGGSGRR
jgi:phage terminase small subunit